MVTFETTPGLPDGTPPLACPRCGAFHELRAHEGERVVPGTLKIVQPAAMSGPSDDDVRAATERALMALRAELLVALLKAPSPDHCLDIARQYRKLLASAVAAADPENMKRIETAMALDRVKVLAIFGTSAWDEPTHPKPLPPESK